MQRSLDAAAAHREARGDSATKLLERVRAVLVLTREHMDRRWKQSDSFPESRRDEARRRACEDTSGVLTHLIGTLLPAVEGSANHGIAVEIQSLLEELAVEVWEPSKVIVVPFASDRYNYGIQSYPDPLAYMSEILDPTSTVPSSSAAAEHFVFLSMPRLERDSGLLHTVILGHEIGHDRDHRYQISARLPFPTLSWGNHSTPPSAQEQQRLGALYTKVVRNWAGELVADIFAALHLGPASLEMLAELVLTMSPATHDSLTHPALDRRAWFITKALQKAGFASVADVAGMMNEYSALAAVAEQRRPTQLGERTLSDLEAAVLDGAWKWLTTNIDNLLGRCENALPSPRQGLASRWEQVARAMRELDRGRPCGEHIELGDGTSPMTVHAVGEEVCVNAAMLLRRNGAQGLRQVLAGQKHLDQHQVDAKLDDLLLKSLEVSSLRKSTQWAQA